MPILSAVDLFAGAGGATQGLRYAGFDVLAAVENDADAAETYRQNHPRVALIEDDIRLVDPVGLMEKLRIQPGDLGLLKACPPCQGFSTLAKGEIDEKRNDLVLDIGRFVRAIKPKSILLENVPGLRRDRRLPELISELSSLGYGILHCGVDATDFGVPQRRKRFILIAILGGEIELPASVVSALPLNFRTRSRTAGDALKHLERYLRADDPLNIYRKSSKVVQDRIASVPFNGNRFDLPEEYQLACHKKITTRSATSSYGRVKLHEPAPTMTTRCTTPACGSFIHPTENRGLTLREAAVFQTFPVQYKFHGSYQSIERQIGNAVPVRMAKGLGLIVRELLIRVSGIENGAQGMLAR